MEVLVLLERIKQSIDLGESQFREFKSAYEGPPSARTARDARSVAKDIGETLVGFSNADGGEMFVGVEDDGTVTGLPFREETVEQLLKAPKVYVHQQTPLGTIEARKVTIGEHHVLYFAVDKSTRFVHITSDGRCLQRKDMQTVPVTAEQLQFERQEQLSREYDRQWVDGASMVDLDLDLVRRISEMVARGMSPEKFLQFLGLADYSMGLLRLRRAALLLFAQDVARWHPRCGVRLVRVQGTELRTGREYNVVSDEVATSNIMSLIVDAWEKLRPHLVQTKLAPDALFKERAMYPEDACREALINAIAHRDYSNEGRNIEIYIFDDRMEVQSPGALLSTVRIDDLKKLQGVHQSRNALVARVLREVGYMREMGEGMRRIFALMRSHDLVSPELRSDSSSFQIVLRHKSVFSDADQRWLDGFRPLKLTREEMLATLLGRNGDLVSPQRIIDTLGLTDTDAYREVVEQLQIKGIIYNGLPRSEAQRQAKSLHISKRSIPRWGIRQPDEVETALGVLVTTVGHMNPVNYVHDGFLRAVLKQLPADSPYKQNPPRYLLSLFRVLGLVEGENREPSSALHSLWHARASLQIAGAQVAPALVSPHPIAIAESTPTPVRDLYVGNLAWSVTEDDLIALFQPYGRVVRVALAPSVNSNRHRGFGFVRMSSNVEAEAILQQLTNTQFRGRTLKLGWAR